MLKLEQVYYMFEGLNAIVFEIKESGLYTIGELNEVYEITKHRAVKEIDIDGDNTLWIILESEVI